MPKLRFTLIAIFAAAALLAGCGSDADSGDADDTTASSDSDQATGDDATSETNDDDDASGNDDESSDSDSDSDSGGGGGSVTIAGESITFDSARCFLEEQDSAGGGGKILFTAQASGVNVDGDEVTIDVSRYDEDSQFAGDDISITIGDPFSPDAETLTAREETGTITVDGSTVSADDVTFSDEALGDAPGSFEILC